MEEALAKAREIAAKLAGMNVFYDERSILYAVFFHIYDFYLIL